MPARLGTIRAGAGDRRDCTTAPGSGCLEGDEFPHLRHFNSITVRIADLRRRRADHDLSRIGPRQDLEDRLLQRGAADNRVIDNNDPLALNNTPDNRQFQLDRQVAVLVPTTVLARQHLETFRQRFADYPVEVEMLSRFRTPQQQRKILYKLAQGGIDIIIGTQLVTKGHDLPDVTVVGVVNAGTRNVDVTLTAAAGAINEIGTGDAAADIGADHAVLSARDEIGGAGELDLQLGPLQVKPVQKCLVFLGIVDLAVPDGDSAEWAELAAEGLTRGSVFIFPAVGHGVLDSHVCAADLVRDFLANPLASNAPACLEQL